MDELQASLAEWAIERDRQRRERIDKARRDGDHYRSLGTPSNPWPYH